MSDILTHTAQSVLNALAPLGAPPLGSADHLRVQSATVRRIADRVGVLQPTTRAAESVPGGEGPGAAHSRASIGRTRMSIDHLVVDLHALSDYLAREAANLDAQQHAWRRRFHARAGGLPRALVDVALSRLGWKVP